MACCRDRNGCLTTEKKVSNGKPVDYNGGGINGGNIVLKKQKRIYRKKKAHPKKVIISAHANKRRVKRTNGKVSCGELIHIAKNVDRNCQKKPRRIRGIETRCGMVIDIVLKDEYIPREGMVNRTIKTVLVSSS